MRSRAPALVAGKMFEPSDDDEDDENGMSIFDLTGMRASYDDERAASSTAATICGQCDETAPPAWHDLFSTGAADSEAESDCDVVPSPSPPAMEPLPARRKDMRGSYDRSDGKGKRPKWAAHVQRHCESIESGVLASSRPCDPNMPERCPNSCRCCQQMATHSLLEEVAIESFGEAVKTQDWAYVTPNHVAVRCNPMWIEVENPLFSPPLRVCVRPSTIGPHAGDGLFVDDVFIPPRRVIGYFQDGSQRMTPEHFFRKYPNGKATHVALFCGQYFDGTHSVWGKMNRAPSKGQLNVRLRRNGSLVTCKPVYPFSELFLAYGNAYRIVPFPTSH